MPASPICTICQSDLTKKRNVITLACGGSHTFCYDCIYEWYMSIRSGTTSYQPHSCPMCFQNGGLLPLREGFQKIYLVNSTEKHHDGESLTVDKFHMVYNSCKCIDPLTGDYCKRGGMEEIRPVNKKYSVFICAHHYGEFRKGTDMHHKCLGFLESPYQKVECECKGCDKRIIKKFSLHIPQKTGTERITLCSEHRKVVKQGELLRLKSGKKLQLHLTSTPKDSLESPCSA